MRTATTRLARGKAAEDLAVAHLKRQGLAIVARNFRTRRGEIDIVARDGDTLVFVEVRLRGSDAFGGAAASITATKQARLVAVASEFIARSGARSACRFDAILLDSLDQHALEWLRNVIET